MSTVLGARYLSCDTCGWRRALRPDARPVEVEVLKQVHQFAATVRDLGDPKHHVVVLRDMTVTLTLDTSGFARALEGAARAGRELAGQMSAMDEVGRDLARKLQEIRWHNQLRAERIAARRWWGDTATAAWARYGWDWPGPAGGS